MYRYRYTAQDVGTVPVPVPHTRCTVPGDGKRAMELVSTSLYCTWTTEEEKIITTNQRTYRPVSGGRWQRRDPAAACQSSGRAGIQHLHSPTQHTTLP